MMKNNLCSNNEEVFEYMKNWFINKALMKRNKTAVVLQTYAQGVGKTTFSNLLYNLFNKNGNLVQISHHCTWLTEKFNGELKGKVLISVEELPRLETSKWHDSAETLKDYITNDTIPMELKGKESKEMPLYVDFVITSNGFHVPLEANNNRRYFVPTVISEKTDEAEKLCNEVNRIIFNDDKLNDEELKEYFRCLYAYCVENYDKSFNIEKVPYTDAIFKNNDEKMNLIYKFVKEFYLKSTESILKNNSGEYYYKIFMKDLSGQISDFIANVNRNRELLKTYNYSQFEFENFVKTKTRNNVIEPRSVSQQLKNMFDKEYFKSETKNNEYQHCIYLEISYNEMLEKFRNKGFINNDEYEEMKQKLKELNGINENNENNNCNNNLSYPYIIECIYVCYTI